MSVLRHELVNVRALLPPVEEIVDAELVDVDDDVLVRPGRTRSAASRGGASASRGGASAARSRVVPTLARNRVVRDAATQRAVAAHERQLWRLVAYTAGGWVGVAIAVALAWRWYRGWVIAMLLVLGLVTALVGSSAGKLRRTKRTGRCLGC